MRVANLSKYGVLIINFDTMWAAMKIFVKNTKTGKILGNYKTVASYNMLPIQYTRVVCSLK